MRSIKRAADFANGAGRGPPATPPIANRADRIFETLKKCGLNWGVSVLRRAVEKANHRTVGWPGAASGHAAALPSAAINSRRPMLTGMCPSLCEGCLVRGTIPRHEQAVFTFGRAGMPVLRRNHNDRLGSFTSFPPSRQQHGGSAWNLIASFQYVHRQAIDVDDRA